MFELIPESLGGSALARAVLTGAVPDAWGSRRPTGERDWCSRAEHVGASLQHDWHTALAPALGESGAALPRLLAAAQGKGVVVTTGQQPGLFGGPLYTFYKALSALAFANTLQELSGVPVAPVFWAATDDSDIAEAAWTAVSERGGARMLHSGSRPGDAIPMSRFPLGDVRTQLEELIRASGSFADAEVTEHLRRAYVASATVGGAYLAFMRSLLEPLGIAVLDASHAATRESGNAILRRALAAADRVQQALHLRAEEIRAAGMLPQVHDVATLSLVFIEENGARRRVMLNEAQPVAERAGIGQLSPNVLLRPVLERAILPSVAYVGGPGEAAYFAQVSAVAASLKAEQPVVIPRWSGTIVDAHIRRILDRRQLQVQDLRSPHEALGRLARREVSTAVLTAIADLRRATDAAFATVEREHSGLLENTEVIRGARAGVHHRIARFERRVIAAAKRRDAQLVEDFGTARGALFPFGKRQERALSFVPFLARHGGELVEELLSGASIHARGVIGGQLALAQMDETPHVGAASTGD